MIEKINVITNFPIGELVQLCMKEKVKCLCIQPTIEQAAEIVKVLESVSENEDEDQSSAQNNSINDGGVETEDRVEYEHRGQDKEMNEDNCAEDGELATRELEGNSGGVTVTAEMGANDESHGDDHGEMPTSSDLENTEALLKELSELEKMAVGNEVSIERNKPKKTLGSSRTTRSRSRALSDGV